MTLFQVQSLGRYLVLERMKWKICGNLYRSSRSVRIMKSKMVRWAGHSARKGELRKA
jgi:hypothetical protein